MIGLPVVGLLGGSFDPVHYGHLLLAKEAKEQIGAKSFRFIPCHNPPHKNGYYTETNHRLAMLELAVAESGKGFIVDPQELYRDNASYSIDTLISLRKELGSEVSLVFVIGWDSFLDLPKWYRWEEFFNYAHFAVAKRPGVDPEIPIILQRLLNDRQVDINALSESPSGKITLLTTTEVSISSTEIRETIGRRDSAEKSLPPAVNSYIQSNQLYL